MSDVTERQELGSVAPEVPHAKLPPATYRNQPNVPPLRGVIGPG